MTAFDNLVEYLQQRKNSYDGKNATFDDYYLPWGNDIQGEHERINIQLPDLDDLQRRLNLNQLEYKYNEEENLDTRCIKFVNLIHQIKLIILDLYYNRNLLANVRRFLASYVYDLYQILKPYANSSDVYWRFRDTRAKEYAEIMLDMLAARNIIEFHKLIVCQLILGRGPVIE